VDIYAWRKLIRASGLSPKARLVAHTLADRMGRTTLECTPSVARVARESGLSERSVQAAVSELRKHGYLWVQFRGSGPQKQRSNLYRAQRPKWLRDDPKDAARDPFYMRF
jgi:DNA-binding transcriptional regulator PaaX